jgi:MFS family permease
MKGLLGLELLFLLGMWISKTAWPLWVQNGGDLGLYGLSYGAMAATGVFAVSLGSFLDRMSPRRAVLLGSIAYAVGISLRWFHRDPLLSVLSGVIGGLGASFLVLTFRTIARHLQGDQPQPAFLAARRIIAAAAMGLGGLAVSGLIAWAPGNRGYAWPIFGAGIPVVLAGVLAGRVRVPEWRSLSPAGGASSRSWNPFASPALREPRLFRLILLNGLCGLCFSLVLPYLPLWYRELGMSAPMVASLSTLATLVSVGAQPLAARLLRDHPPHRIYAAGEILHWGCVALLLAAGSVHWIIPLAMSRSLFRGFSGLAEEVMEMKLIPVRHAALGYGALQSAFLIGDSLGGAMGGLLAKALSLPAVLAIAVIFSSFHGIAFYRLARPPIRVKQMRFIRGTGSRARWVLRPCGP